jgi:hypothetical protein
MTLAAGALLGPHEIVLLIGAGGMGEVYKPTFPFWSWFVHTSASAPLNLRPTRNRARCHFFLAGKNSGIR